MQNIAVDPKDWRPFFYELIMHLTGKPKEEWPELLNLFNLSFSVILKEQKGELSSVLLDTIWVLDLQLESDAKRQLMAEILRFLLGKGYVPSVIAKERLEPDLLELSGAIQSSSMFMKKLVRINTGMFYKQQKFNLFREESEGFAKLISLLFTFPGDINPQTLFEQVIGLIGFFDLDPTRVLDVILDEFAFATNEKFPIFIELLRLCNFPSETVASVFCFKLQWLAEQKDPDAFEGLTKVLALLLREKIVLFEQIYPNLLPAETDTMKVIESRGKAILSATRSSLGMLSSKEKDDGQTIQTSLGYHEAGLGLLEFEVLDNQIVNLTRWLIYFGDIESAKKIIERIQFIVSLNINISRSICQHLNGLIGPLYNKYYSQLEIDFDEEQMIEELRYWLFILGPGLYSDGGLFTKLCRILKGMFTNRKELVEYLLINFMLPALSLSSANAALSFELWSLLELFPYSDRYGIYHTWKTQVYDGGRPEVKYARTMAIQDIRKVMRRLAKENVKQFGRLIGKISHANPAVVLPIIIDQLQAYDNLIIPAVEAFRYLTPLSYDILIYSLLEALSNPEKDRLKEDGTSIASWLQNLATLTAALLRKYSALSPLPILQYVVQQLRDDNTLDLVVLSELLSKLAGLESKENMVDEELASLAGGQILRSEISLKHEAVGANPVKTSKKSSQRLLTSLKDGQLAIPLWLLLGRMTFMTIYRTDISHQKLLGILLDQCHSVFTSYTNFLLEHAKEAGLQYDSLPSNDVLQKDFGLLIDVIWYMRRLWSKAFTDGISNFEAMKQVIIEPTTILLPKFQRAFWCLELSDLWVPERIYSNEISRLKTLILTAAPPLLLSEIDKTRWLKDKERAGVTAATLENELDQRKVIAETVLQWLKENCDSFFCPSAGRMDIVDHLLKECIIRRALFSPIDAMYAAHFLSIIHDIGAAHFSSLSCYDRLINQVHGLLFTLSEREAHCYGRFLDLVLETLHRWHSEVSIYESQAIGDGRPGFSQRWKSSSTSNATETVDGENGQEEKDEGKNISSVDDGNLLAYEDYRHVLYKWHLKLHKAFVTALESGEYQFIRNAIIVLSRISNHFPALRKVGASLEKAVAKVKDAEEGKREDLKLLAVRCSAVLLSSKPRWLPEDQFHQVQVTETVQSPKRPIEEQLEGQVKRLKLEEAASGSGTSSSSRPPKSRQNSSSNSHPVVSSADAERELRRKLEERKKQQESQQSPAPASSSSRLSRESSSRRDREREHRNDRGEAGNGARTRHDRDEQSGGSRSSRTFSSSSYPRRH